MTQTHMIPMPEPEFQHYPLAVPYVFVSNLITDYGKYHGPNIGDNIVGAHYSQTDRNYIIGPRYRFQ